MKRQSRCSRWRDSGGLSEMSFAATYLVAPHLQHTPAVPARYTWILRHPPLLQAQAVMPHRARRVPRLGRVANAPRPEEPVLQRIHVGKGVARDARPAVLVPVHPALPRIARAGPGRDVRGRRADAVEPLAAVVDGVGPLAADGDAVVGGRVVGSASPAACGPRLRSERVSRTQKTRCSVGSGRWGIAGDRQQLTFTSQLLLLGSPKARYGCWSSALA